MKYFLIFLVVFVAIINGAIFCHFYEWWHLLAISITSLIAACLARLGQ